MELTVIVRPLVAIGAETAVVTGAVVVAIAVVRASALRACASIEAIRAALSPCWWRRPATNRLRVSAASASERARAAAAAASRVSSASRAASRVSSAASRFREARACSMILLFSPAARLRLSRPVNASSSDCAPSRMARGSAWPDCS